MTGPRIAICVPWFPTKNIARDVAFRAVEAHYRKGGWPVYVSRYSRERAAARNEVAHAALDDGAGVLVFNDADTLCPAGQLEQAVQLADSEPGIVYAYDLYVRLSREASESIENDPSAPWPLLFERQLFGAPSIGCVSFSRDTFLQAGPLDEDYHGWGYEDLAWVDACNRLASARRVPGPCFHLWHGPRRDDDSPEDADRFNAELNRQRWLKSRRKKVA